MRIYLDSIGCRLNEAEREQWARGFRAAGHPVVADVAQADLAVFNTCAVTIAAARTSRKRARQLYRQNPRARLVVTGCYAELEPETMAGIAGVDLVVPNETKDDLVEQVLQAFDVPAMPALAQDPSEARVFPGALTRAFVKAQDGCRHRCTFCITTVARGAERSRPVDEVVDEVNLLHDRGYREVVLSGVHLGGYGRDRDTSLQALVEAVLERTQVPRIRLSSLEPWDLPEGFFALWDDPRLCPHLHLPMQSGADSVLRRMARRCTTDEFVVLAEHARERIPDLHLGTDLIVGFPRESEEEFEQTLDFVRRIGFADAHMFTWSPREGTAAARMRGRIDPEIQRERSQRLHDLVAELRAQRLREAVGSVRPVLWEGPGEAVSEGVRRFGGYTDTYLRARVEVPAGTDLHNRVVPTTLLGVTEGGYLRGAIPG